MRHMLGMAVMAGSLMVASGAQAQSWSVYVGNGAPPSPPPYGMRWHDDGAERMMDFICSGQRAHGLEERLGHEVDEGDIDPGTADRMHAAIDGLEGRQRKECAEGDVRSVREIGWRYDRIAQWMDTAAHGSARSWGQRGWGQGWTPGWRPRW